tara:strand:+ start:9348 stop:10952 length:1605 start_codon:yes stop_codon:yes gene_type:complete
MKNFNNKLKEILFVSKITEIKNKKLTVSFSIFLTNIGVLSDILIIVIFASFFKSDSISSNALFNFFIERSYLLPIIIVLRFLCIYLDKMIQQNLQLNVRESLRKRVLREILKKGNFSVADSTFFVNELTMHVSYFYGALTLAINFVVQLILYGSFLLYESFEIIGIFTLAILILFFPTRYFLRLGRKYIHISFTNSQNISSKIQRIIDNLFLIKILNTQNLELKRFSEESDNFFDAQYKNYKYGVVNSILPNFLTTFIFAFIIVVFNFAKLITLEFLGVVLRFVQALSNLNGSLNALINSHVHLEKLVELEKYNPQTHQSNFILDEKLGSAIILKDVNFKYFGSNDYIFNKLDLEIPLNKHIVITGPNGTGKSTLIGLMSGVLIPESGDILIKSDRLGYIGATPLIFESSLRDNLIYNSKKSFDDNYLYEKLDKLHFKDDKKINLDTVISNKSLSSGQMQKIAFIRALINDVEILFLDESTANLDNEAKKIISGILKSEKITIINSTHNAEDFDFDFKVNVFKDKNKSNITLED